MVTQRNGAGGLHPLACSPHGLVGGDAMEEWEQVCLAAPRQTVFLGRGGGALPLARGDRDSAGAGVALRAGASVRLRAKPRACQATSVPTPATRSGDGVEGSTARRKGGRTAHREAEESAHREVERGARDRSGRMGTGNFGSGAIGRTGSPHICGATEVFLAFAHFYRKDGGAVGGKFFFP
ncbi:hypothetical protein SEVIR_4G168126v4 [Setaria viridis]